MTDIMKALASLAADLAPLRQRNTKTVRVLLVSTYELGRQPFGLASPAACLRADGHQVTCTDLAVEKLSLDTVRNADLIAFHLPMHTATRLAVPVTIVDGLTRNRHVVGIHDAVNETNEHPFRDQFRLARNDRVKQRAIPVRGIDALRIMPADDMIGETTDRIHISARREELKGSDPDVAGRDTSKNRAGQRCFAPNRLARRHGGKSSGRRNSERHHRLADYIFA